MKKKQKIGKPYKNSNFPFYGAIAFVFVFMIFVVASGKGTYSNEDMDDVSITCPEKISAGNNFSCTVGLNITDFVPLSLNATYNLPDSISFVSFVPNGTYENTDGYVFEASQTKFALGYIDGLTNGVVGTLTLKLDEDVSDVTTFNIGLSEIEVTREDENEEIVLQEIADVNTTVEISSNVNTLSSLSVGEFDLNPIFNSNVFEYAVTVSNDTAQVDVSAVATDQNASVAGIGTFDLHYGTQELSIVVTSESGEDKEYTVSVYRPYVFETDYYIYDKTNNYIYTRDDYSAPEIISNLNNDGDNGISYEVADNKLVVKYVDEELLKVDIINFKTLVYTISDSKLYIGNNVTYDEFTENIVLNGINMKVFDNEDNEVTDGNISDGFKVSIYRDDLLLEQYNVLSQYLYFDIGLMVDDDNKIISRLSEEMTFEQLTSKISTSGEFSFKNSRDEVLTSSDIIGTGSKITIDFGDSSVTYILSVLGDVSGDGYITISDVSMLYRSRKKILNLDDIQTMAGDVILDNNIEINDVSRLYRYYRKVIPKLEVE